MKRATAALVLAAGAAIGGTAMARGQRFLGPPVKKPPEDAGVAEGCAPEDGGARQDAARSSGGDGPARDADGGADPALADGGTSQEPGAPRDGGR